MAEYKKPDNTGIPANPADPEISLKKDFVSDTAKIGGATYGIYPWDGMASSNDPFFPSWTIATNRWNQLFPYSLQVIDIANNNTPIGGNNTVKTEKGEEGFDFVINQEILTGSWIYNLPITPQMISIQDNYAINTTATFRGVVEEHNGVKFKLINIQGSTGIWAQKPSVEGKLSQKGFANAIFGGAIEAFNGVVNQIKSIATAATGKHPANPAKNENPDKIGKQHETGYFQALLLSQFLERYSMEKKNPDNKNWRLVFNIPKENQAFIVTPVAFNLQKSAQRPMEYTFSLQLKAWKRIQLANGTLAGKQELPSLDLDVLQQVNSTIRATRLALSQSVNLVKAVRSDISAPFTALRQTALAVKDLSGLINNIGDFPKQIVNDAKSSIEEIGDTLSFRGRFGQDPVMRGKTTPQAKTSYAINALMTRKQINEGLSIDQVQSGALGKDSIYDSNLDPVNEIFQNPEEYFDFFDGIPVDALQLTPEQIQAINDEVENARLLNIHDFRIFKQTLIDLANDIANQYGSGDTTYASVYNKPTPKTRSTPMTVEENEILNSLYEAIQAFDLLVSTKQYDDLKTQSPLEFVGGYANQVGIDVENFTSKYLVPVPFGFTIEEIAARYMGNADKWLEIATINGLRSPYIDEVGFTMPLLSNADNRRFTISDTESRLYIGQKIELMSDIVQKFVRSITDLQSIGNGVYVVTVNGEADLGTLKAADNAKIRGYLPGTVNSQNQIYIPSNQPYMPDDRVFPIHHLNEDKYNKISKVDLLLSENGDLAVNSVGDIRLANGITNLVQALKIKVITRKGTLLRHPEFGLGLTAGISVADVESGNIAKELNKIVTDDPRFAGIESLNIQIKNGTIYVTMTVKIANGNGIIPITFNTNM